MKQKAGSLKKVIKIDKPLANLTKIRREKTQISKIRKANVAITTNTEEIQGIIRDYLRTYSPINLKILKKWTDF
jgi:hypothetical protein